jgi:hypothetical protein
LEQLNALRSLGRFDLIERDALGAGVAPTVVGEETPPISRESIHFRELPPFVRDLEDAVTSRRMELHALQLTGAGQTFPNTGAHQICETTQ